MGHSPSFVLPLPPLSMRVDYGERVSIIGHNGIGKSTLLHTLTQDMKPISGSVEIGRDLRVGNLMQEHESLPRKSSPREFIRTMISKVSFLIFVFPFFAIVSAVVFALGFVFNSTRAF